MKSQKAEEKIPHIIHQTWKTRDLPSMWIRLQKTWIENHPDWEYRFTTDAENRQFFAESYPWFLPIYDAYPLDICRAEAFRYFVVYHYGGVYVDLDFESYRPLNDLLEGQELVFAPEPPVHATRTPGLGRGFDRVLCNAFLASAVKHPFWEHLQRLLVEHQNDSNFLDATGIYLFTRVCNSYPDASSLTILESELLYPINYDQARVYSDPEQLRERFAPHSYAIHYWSGSWWRDALLESGRRRIKHAHRNDATE